MSIVVLQSSWWGRESWLLCLICLPGISWWLSCSSSLCHGVVCGLWLWYFLIIDFTVLRNSNLRSCATTLCGRAKGLSLSPPMYTAFQSSLINNNLMFACDIHTISNSAGGPPTRKFWKKVLFVDFWLTSCSLYLVQKALHFNSASMWPNLPSRINEHNLEKTPGAPGIHK